MADIASRDANFVATIQGVSSVDLVTPTNIAVNPTTGAIDIDSTSLYSGLDSRYLELTAANSPLTGALAINVTSSTAFRVGQSATLGYALTVDSSVTGSGAPGSVSGLKIKGGALFGATKDVYLSPTGPIGTSLFIDSQIGSLLNLGTLGGGDIALGQYATLSSSLGTSFQYITIAGNMDDSGSGGGVFQGWLFEQTIIMKTYLSGGYAYSETHLENFTTATGIGLDTVGISLYQATYAPASGVTTLAAHQIDMVPFAIVLAGGSTLTNQSFIHFQSGGTASATNNYAIMDESGYDWLIGTGKLNIGGKVNTYNNITTAGYGVPAIVDSQSLTNQGADITTTNFTNAGTAGLYEVEYILEDTTAAAGAGTVTLTISWTDAAGATTATATQVLTATGRASGVIAIQLNSGNITYTTTHTGIYSTAKYALYMSCIRLK